MMKWIIPYQKNIFLSFSALIVLVLQASGQRYRMQDHWFVGSQISVVSFFGDLSVHDFNPVRKVTEESNVAWGIFAGKSINRYADLRISYNHGFMKGKNPGLDMYFSNVFNELTFCASVNLSHLYNPYNKSEIDLFFTTGSGIIGYRSIKNRVSDGTYVSSEGFNPQKEPVGKAGSSLVVPVGFELNYQPGKNWTYLLSFSFRLHNQDLLDSHLGSTGISDRYSLTSVGIFYLINSVKKKTREKIPGAPLAF